ncbi:hypothetical protein KQI52_12640 [bacterium]|nr:hypothetical protein [bacterium]
MDRFTKDDLKTLMDKSGEFHASIYLPTVRAGDQVDQNPIRFKNRIRDLEKQMQALDARQNDIDTFLAPLWEMQQDHEFWQHQSDGLAVFNSPGFFAWYRLPVQFDKLTVLTDRFHLKPLLHMFNEDGNFHVLAISQGQTRLYRCTRWSIEPVEVKDMPASIDDTTMFDVAQKTVRGREGAGPGSSVWHGQGRGEDKKLATLKRYADDINRALVKHFGDPKTTVVLACVDYLVPFFRDRNSAMHIVDEHISGNPDHLRMEELHQKGWEAAKPLFDQDRKKAQDRFHELNNTEQASVQVDNVLRAAFRGRVETAFVADDKREWGFYYPDTDTVERRSEKNGMDEDLLDFTALQTIVHGGKVYVLPQAEVPGQNSVAAIYRF